MLDNKRKVRRAIEAAGIPFTYVSANSFAAYFVDYLLHPHEKIDEVTVYGSGEAKGTSPKLTFNLRKFNIKNWLVNKMLKSNWTTF